MLVRDELAIRHVSIRQHTSAYISIRQHTSAEEAHLVAGEGRARYKAPRAAAVCLHTSAYVSIRQHTLQGTAAAAVCLHARCAVRSYTLVA
jgi:hypothetical protein